MLTTIHVINISSTFFDLWKVGRPDSKENGLDSDISFEYFRIVGNLLYKMIYQTSVVTLFFHCIVIVYLLTDAL